MYRTTEEVRLLSRQALKAVLSVRAAPICSGAQVILGINDLTSLEPELALEWSEQNEIKPTEVSVGSHKQVLRNICAEKEKERT